MSMGLSVFNLITTTILLPFLINILTNQLSNYLPNKRINIIITTIIVVIVIVINYFFGNPLEKKRLTVFVRDDRNNIAKSLINKSKISAFHNHKTETKDIGENGEIDFDEIIPPTNDSLELHLIDSDNYESVYDKKIYEFKGEPIIYKVKLKDETGKIEGRVFDAKTQKGLKVTIYINVDTSYESELNTGNFKIQLPEYFYKESYDLRFECKGYKTEMYNGYKPKSNSLPMPMHKIK